MIFMVEHSKIEQMQLIKERQNFNCKEKDNIVYNYPKKEKIVFIWDNIIKNSNYYGKRLFFPKLRKVVY